MLSALCAPQPFTNALCGVFVCLSLSCPARWPDGTQGDTWREFYRHPKRFCCHPKSYQHPALTTQVRRLKHPGCRLGSYLQGTASCRHRCHPSDAVHFCLAYLSPPFNLICSGSSIRLVNPYANSVFKTRFLPPLVKVKSATLVNHFSLEISKVLCRAQICESQIIYFHNKRARISASASVILGCI